MAQRCANTVATEGLEKFILIRSIGKFSNFRFLLYGGQGFGHWIESTHWEIEKYLSL